LTDLLQRRQFLTGNGLFAFFDASWLPIYLILLFLFHWSFGLVAVISSVVLILLAFWNEIATRQDLKDANRIANESGYLTQRHLRNVEAIDVMGMLPCFRSRWWDV
jgi:ABC-type protease/lipase transport system fused ATPase/permease subunit